MRAGAPISVLVAATLLVGCASERPQADKLSTEGTTVVQTAEVTNVRDMTVHDGHSSGLGSVVGAILGGVAGNAIGGGNGNAVATIAGSVGGSLAGQHVEQSNASRSSLELTLRFANGAIRTYQVAPDESFRVGDTVTVTTNRGLTRITH
ncbi:glycine zipper 2TM domain-containing protein [Noviherbaspirillum sp.]|uniref:glycine zipper 2TM domain-containing protein n=1 Tax=Noviherbaspirillum sp. TaxID=1926288 RepID=UPI002B4727E2|nr:glycine zipper 2TM domain-containing protein [Noviherbaspirillum sp.]HJV83610.1 glycine zipper 2TM domain-containing protein [Noviherbaspirillum sp.]